MIFLAELAFKSDRLLGNIKAPGMVEDLPYQELWSFSKMNFIRGFHY